MTGPRPWIPRPLEDLTAIPVVTDPTVTAGRAVLDVDPGEPRHIIRVRANSHDFTLTAGQVDQVRDHYRAMSERAARLLDWWRDVAARHGLPR